MLAAFLIKNNYTHTHGARTKGALQSRLRVLKVEKRFGCKNNVRKKHGLQHNHVSSIVLSELHFSEQENIRARHADKLLLKFHLNENELSLCSSSSSEQREQLAIKTR
jgi:hypothetical protein